uniref:(California timema) hypothetical protein n=1 Tax=Timema californicum TaxID=61474 RepID=A0A7R9IX93_TIMCA|nr:unnamed protein product [Timema californicum]
MPSSAYPPIESNLGTKSLSGCKTPGVQGDGGVLLTATDHRVVCLTATSEEGARHQTAAERGRSYLEGMYPHLLRGMKTTLEKSTLNTAELDSILDLPVIGSLVYCVSSALNLAATEASDT